MGQDEIFLKQGQIVIGDAFAGQLAEARVDPVHRVVLRQNVGNDRGGAFHLRARSGCKPDRRAGENLSPVRKGCLSRRDRDRLCHWPLQILAKSGLKPMR